MGEALSVAMRGERSAVVDVTADDDGVVERILEKRPDVVVLDAGDDPAGAANEIARRCPDTRILVLISDEDDHTAARVLNAGAAGFVSKRRPLRDLVRAVHAVYQGRDVLPPEEMRRLRSRIRRRREQDAALRARVERLTRRETEILQLMADGRPPNEILSEMAISRHTFRTHVQNILFKLREHSKVEALAHAIRYGKVRPREPV